MRHGAPCGCPSPGAADSLYGAHALLTPHPNLKGQWHCVIVSGVPAHHRLIDER
jgi:hypothetical protein